MNEKIYKSIINYSLQKLISELGYSQIEIFKKFEKIEIKVSRATISNLYNGKKVSAPFLRKAANGFQQIMERELCLKYIEDKNKFERIENCSPRPIIISKDENIIETISERPTYSIFDGRRDVEDKVNLFNNANYEIIEMGIRLKNFRSYFEEKRESAFLDPLRKILEKGINFKCYSLNPNGNYAKRYIEDRAIAQPSERILLEEIPQMASELKKIFLKLNREGFKGKMELYQYDHFPYYHATIVDGGTENGVMNIAPYLYGISRANTPVIELDYRNNKILFKKYWKSIKKLINSPQVSQLI